MIITQTPFRMSFFGGGTDFPDFYKEHGGAVISTTFDKYCYVNVRHLPRFFDYSNRKRAARSKSGSCWKVCLISKTDFLHIEIFHRLPDCRMIDIVDIRHALDLRIGKLCGIIEKAR